MSNKSDDEVDFIAAYDEARMKYIEQVVEERTCNSYFKFENGTITKIESPHTPDTHTPNRIFLPIDTINHLNNTQDIGGIFHEHEMMPAIVTDEPIFIDYNINGDSIHREAFIEVREREFEEYIQEARSLPKMYDALYPAMMRVKRHKIEDGYMIGEKILAMQQKIILKQLKSTV